MGTQRGGAGLVGASPPNTEYVRRHLIEDTRPWRRAVSLEVAMECAVRGEPETDRSTHGVKVGAVIGGGVQRFRFGGQPLAHLSKVEKTVCRAVQCVGDHGVNSGH